MPLNDVAVRSLKEPDKHSDERGLFLLVTPAGGKWWCFRYQLSESLNYNGLDCIILIRYRFKRNYFEVKSLFAKLNRARVINVSGEQRNYP